MAGKVFEDEGVAREMCFEVVDVFVCDGEMCMVFCLTGQEYFDYRLLRVDVSDE